MKKILMGALIIGLMFLSISSANACSRVTYTTTSGNVVTGRTMDWVAEDSPVLLIYKKGVNYTSVVKNNPAQWTSKYGVVGIVSFKTILNSGLNEKGLAGDILWLEESNYGKLQNNELGLGVSEYLKYLLDNFATVNEVVEFVNSGKIRPVITYDKVSNTALKLHYILTDKTGDNAIIEYTNGVVNVYHKKGRIALTNDPSYEKMCAIRDYYKEIGILNNMPGSSLSQARFIYLTGWIEDFTNKKLTGYIKGISNQDFDTQAMMSVLSLMRGVSTPLGVELTAATPNNTSTLWRTVIDVKNNKLYFDSGLTMLTIWVDADKLDFSKDYKPIPLNADCKLNGDITEAIMK